MIAAMTQEKKEQKQPETVAAHCSGAVMDSAVAIYRKCFNALDKGENWTEDSAAAYFRDLMQRDGALFWTLRIDGDIIGISGGCDLAASIVWPDMPPDISQAFDPQNVFYFAVTAIDPRCQGAGYGRDFSAAWMRDVKAKNYRGIVGRCRADNLPMRRIFEKSGFQIIREYQSEMGGVTCDRILLYKEL